MRKTLVAMIAAVLVIGGAVGAMAQTDDSASDVTSETVVTERPLRAHLLGELLDEMVTDGVIDADQATAITEWLQERRSDFLERRAERLAAHEAAWVDGVLTTEEAADLPGAERLLAEEGPLAEAWEDGELTREEFESARPAFARRGPGAAHRGWRGPADS